jgi:vacuolar-type H+-ATPase subunit H
MSNVLAGVQQAEAEATKIIEKAQEKAEQIRRQAERDARETEASVRSDLLVEINALRQEVEKKAKTQAKQILAKAEKEAAVFKEQGSKNMKKAAGFIVQAVYDIGGGSK